MSAMSSFLNSLRSSSTLSISSSSSSSSACASSSEEHKTNDHPPPPSMTGSRVFLTGAFTRERPAAAAHNTRETQTHPTATRTEERTTPIQNEPNTQQTSTTATQPNKVSPNSMVREGLASSFARLCPTPADNHYNNRQEIPSSVAAHTKPPVTLMEPPALFKRIQGKENNKRTQPTTLTQTHTHNLSPLTSDSANNRRQIEDTDRTPLATDRILHTGNNSSWLRLSPSFGLSSSPHTPLAPVHHSLQDEPLSSSDDELNTTFLTSATTAGLCYPDLTAPLIEAAHILKESSEVQDKIIPLLTLMLNQTQGGEHAQLCTREEPHAPWIIEAQTHSPSYPFPHTQSAEDEHTCLYDHPVVPLSVLGVVYNNRSMLTATRENLSHDPEFAKDVYLQTLPQPVASLTAVPMMQCDTIVCVLLMYSWSNPNAFLNVSVPLLQMIGGAIGLILGQRRPKPPRTATLQSLYEQVLSLEEELLFQKQQVALAIIAQQQAEDAVKIEKQRAQRFLEHAAKADEKALALKAKFLSTLSHNLRTPLHSIDGHARLLSVTKMQPEQRECVVNILQSSKMLCQTVDELLGYKSVKTVTEALMNESNQAVMGRAVSAPSTPIATRSHAQAALVATGAGAGGGAGSSSSSVTFAVPTTPVSRPRAMSSQSALPPPSPPQSLSVPQSPTSSPRRRTGVPLLAPILPLTILCADDNTVNQKLCRMFLVQLGYVDSVTVVGDGYDAVKEVLKGKPLRPVAVGGPEPARDAHDTSAILDNPADVSVSSSSSSSSSSSLSSSSPVCVDYDVIVMDVGMAGLDGISATRMIRSLSLAGRTQPFIIGHTADVTAANREACINAGMNAFVPKPMNIELMVEVLKQAAKWLETQN